MQDLWKHAPSDSSLQSKDTKEPSNQEELGEMKNCEEAETIPKQAVSNCSSVCHSIGERGSLTNSMICFCVDIPQRQSSKGNSGVCSLG